MIPQAHRLSDGNILLIFFISEILRDVPKMIPYRLCSHHHQNMFSSPLVVWVLAKKVSEILGIITFTKLVSRMMNQSIGTPQSSLVLNIGMSYCILVEYNK